MAFCMMQMLFDIASGLKIEMCVFIFGACLHLLLFSKRRLPEEASKVKLGKKVDGTLANCSAKLSGESSPGSATPSAVLLRALKPLLRSPSSTAQALETEIRNVIASHHLSQDAEETLLISVLDGLGKTSNDSKLLEAIQSYGGSSKMEKPRLLESLLRGYMALRLRTPFEQLLKDIRAHAVSTDSPIAIEILILAFQSELGTNSFDGAMQCLKELATSSQKTSTALTPKHKPVMQQFARLAAERGSLAEVLDALVGCKFVNALTVEGIFVEAAQAVDKEMLGKVKRAAEKEGVELPPAARCALLVGKVLGGASDAEVLDYYNSELLSDVDVLTMHTKAGRLVAEAAIRTGQDDSLKRLVKDCEDCRKVGLLKSFGSEGRFRDAQKLFDVCPEKTSCLYNALLDAAISVGNSETLGEVMQKIECSGVADVVTYNTLIKGHLQEGDITRAMKVLQEMGSKGLRPNVVTFNELIDTSAAAKPETTWSLIQKMNEYGLKPNKVTCSILLKSLQPNSKSTDVEHAISLLSQLDGAMDEVLLSSVCEACIRTNRADLLVQQLRRQRSSKGAAVQGAHTFGSLIRAYGFINDLDGIWVTWTQMKKQNIVPTSITVGCMVEALVTNDALEEGYQLIRELAKDEQTQPLINSAIYGSLLKGFSRQKRFDRVWKVYDEMMALKLGFTVVTFNSLIDVCARSGEMNRVQPLMEDMTKTGIEPNVITYSTVLKGYCSANRLDEAFMILEEMKRNSNLRPDEVTYNTLLDGCARQGLFDRGMSVLTEMRTAGVSPSNFTLSVLVKLATRSKRTNKAFELCDEISKEFRLRLNIHVYNNLIQACISNNDHRRSHSVFEQLLGEKVKPDQRTYLLLLKASIAANNTSETSALLRSAYGLRGGLVLTAPYAGLASLQGRGGLQQDALKEGLDFLSGPRGNGQMAVQLALELSRLPGVKLDSQLRHRLLK
eukprot:TRINITY_DN79387_c0_g1_i1.p1 TRINITY_DN79387_c0_g1~~TRINITY_DN79387_c0_g1_i1.p1  ORF type:complete len:954 (+),score=224.23 TRINITY_DN79387_c0_g1_i1:150-3011(+)